MDPTCAENVDPLCAMGRVGVKQACTGPKQRYGLAQSEVGKRKERSFGLKCERPYRPHTTLSGLGSTFQRLFCTGWLSPGESYSTA